MGKSAADVNLFATALMRKPKLFPARTGFEGLRVGFLDPRVWRLDDEASNWPEGTREQMVRLVHSATKSDDLTKCRSQHIQTCAPPCKERMLK